ncbi:shematrin-like protein 1 [Daphnia magna]|uniref:shematrin-like protein 1 n=1 Tax=Daphnia magna TaxID=35525 RepID=UPI001E1BB08C|nr:shematrin-like protein 1 [Daphnia magna]
MNRLIGTIFVVLLVIVAVTLANDEREDIRQKRQFGGTLGLLNGFLYGYGHPGYGYGRYPYYGYPYPYVGHRPAYRPYHYFGHRWTGYGW